MFRIIDWIRIFYKHIINIYNILEYQQEEIDRLRRLIDSKNVDSNITPTATATTLASGSQATASVTVIQ